MNLSVSLSNTKQKKHAIAIAIACSFLLVLPSCIPNLRHPAPGPNLPESFNLRQADRTRPAGALKRPARKTQPRSGSKSFSMIRCLLSLIHQALVGNQELRILDEDIQIASNEILARQGAYLPFVTAGGGAGLNRFSQLHA